MKQSPTGAVPANETWLWDERWQAGERDVDNDLAAGNVLTAHSVQEFVGHLTELVDTSEAARPGRPVGDDRQ